MADIASGNTQLLRLEEDLKENLSSVQIAKTLDDLIFKAIDPLIRNSKFVEYTILELLPHVFLNKRRKFSSKKVEDFRDALFSFIMSDNTDEKIALLRKQTLERTVYFALLDRFNRDAIRYLDAVQQKIRGKNIDTGAKQLKEQFFIEGNLYEICQSTLYWTHYAYKFRAMVVKKFVRFAQTESVKMIAGTSLNVDQEELSRNLILVTHKAIDKYDSDQGPLANYVNIWFREAKTNPKNAHEYGVAMQMSSSQRKKLHGQGLLQTFTVELDEKIAESIEDFDYDVLQNMIDTQEDFIQANLSCRVDSNKIFCLLAGIHYTLTPDDLRVQQESCNA